MTPVQYTPQAVTLDSVTCHQMCHISGFLQNKGHKTAVPAHPGRVVCLPGIEYDSVATGQAAGSGRQEEVSRGTSRKSSSLSSSQDSSALGMAGDSRAGVQIWGPVNAVLMEALTGLDSRSDLLISHGATLSQGRARWIAPLEDGYLQAQEEIEAEDPQMVAQATELATGRTEDDAYQIYTFAAEHLSWPGGTRTDVEQSALAADQTGIGGCGEFANLMTALCRAAAIPAASITGLAMPWGPPLLTQRATWSHPGGAHAWVEVYTSEHWTFADPSWASQFPTHGLWFGYTRGTHPSYGKLAAHDEVYDDILHWAEIQGEVIGAMSAPLKFVAATRGDQVFLTVTLGTILPDLGQRAGTASLATMRGG